MLEIFRNNKVLSFLVIVIVSALTFDALGKVLSLLFLGINVFSPDFSVSSLSVSDEITFYRFNQPFQTIGIFLVPSLLIKYLLDKRSTFHFSSYSLSFSLVFASIILMFMLKPTVSWFAYINSTVDFSFLGDIGVYLMDMSILLSEKVSLITQSHSNTELAINLLVIAVIPAISEEFFFRGLVQNYLITISKKPHLSIFISSLIFGMIHFNIQGFLPILFLGLILGYIYYYTQNIWVSIIAHFVNNASLLVFISQNSNNMSEIDFESPSTNSIIFSVVMSFALMFFIYSVWENRKGESLK
ncbi:MAG: CPBP family intramembrane metalloprotease [Flavobacteriales bacterium]|nr:CPBP family intramembrane metalloprotease [Flavobacteriales bacterium]